MPVWPSMPSPLESRPLERDSIYARLPHAGDMRLLDAVLHWNRASITCIATSHADARHPLRNGAALAGLHALEYAAQAIAVHCCLAYRDAVLDEVYVAAFRKVTLTSASLDALAHAVLRVDAWQQAAVAQGASYGFSVDCHATPIARGVATVALPFSPDTAGIS